jgi:hypothetical protein
MSSSTPSSAPLEAAGLDALLTAADRLYREGAWSAAQMLYHQIITGAPAVADPLGLPLRLTHCMVELASSDAVEQIEFAAAPPRNSAREAEFSQRALTRAIALCHAGDFARASRILRLVATCFFPIVDAYANLVVRGRTECSDLIDRPPVEVAPPFLADGVASAEEIARLKRELAGRTILVVCRRYTPRSPERCHELADNIVDSARDFGFAVAELNSHFLDPGVTIENFAEHLRAGIAAARPQLLLFDDLFETGASSAVESDQARIAEILAEARRNFGTRVVKTLPDAWWVAANGDERVFRGLGDIVDLVHHCNPSILGRGTPAQNRGVFCYVYPMRLPPVAVPYGALPRAGFVGGIGPASPARVVAWAESMRRGLPIEFRIGAPPWASGPVQQPDDATYTALLRSYQMIVNVTRRTNGVTALVGRAIETMLAGGVLLEEDSIDTAYFFQRGRHYQPFATLADLEELVPRLMDDPARRTRMSQVGQQWAERYFSGDIFWAELLRRLFG